MYLLDTNILSELRKIESHRADANVRNWAAQENVEHHYISAMTMFEIEMGILRLARKDPEQATLLRDWQQNYILPEFEDRTLAMDTDVALQAAALHVPDPKPERDAIIAATALVHDMVLVTRNVADFVATGVRLFNPWGEAGR